MKNFKNYRRTQISEMREVTESDITNKQGEVKAAVTANSF